jgi:hypothetical protein
MILVWLAAFVALAALGVWIMLPRVEMWAAGVHQKAVTREIRSWEQEYGSVTNDASAIASAEMVAYTTRYYVPGPGYRGPTEVEMALQTQRNQTILRLAEALERYTGLDYGTNATKWEEWADERKKQLSKPEDSEQDGAANGSQPIRSQINRTSSAAGSRR